ncbi:MAG TPA: PhzF family phenazine biosynthesis protein [Chitinophagaceae bacterium]|nr:PhzF family phenazine biosynthesis protein [Chitinophagaceae bacterium]
MILYQVDAFTDKLFGGNPAAIVPLEKWMDEKLMQQLALENNLSETAFICSAKNTGYDFEIRWFTPELEINLCGHATLASAFIIFNYLDFPQDEIRFSSQSGILKVKKNNDLIEMDFPSWKPEAFNEDIFTLSEALGGVDIKGVYKHRDLLIELADENAVQNCKPDFALIKSTGYKIIITAAGRNTDFVSRFFAPTAGVDEDPVTGSAHSQLIPFWSERLHKKTMKALQLSKRGGAIYCEQRGDRVMMGGNCVFYMKGEFETGLL